MTCICFLSWGFTVVLLELDDDLDEVFLLGLYKVCGSGSTAISGMSQGTSMWGWSPVWCVLAIMMSPGVMVSWSTSYDGICYVIWNNFCVSYFWLWLWYLQECDCNLDLLHQYLSQWWCLEFDLGQCLVLEFCTLWACRYAWWWYSIQTVHYYMTIFITFNATYIWAMMGNVA